MPTYEEFADAVGLKNWPLWLTIVVLIAIIFLRDTKLLQYVESKLVALAIAFAKLFRLSARGARKARLQSQINALLENLDEADQLSHNRVALRWITRQSVSSREDDRVVLVVPSIGVGAPRLTAPLREFFSLTHLLGVKQYVPASLSSALDDVACLDLLRVGDKAFEAREYGRDILKEEPRDPSLNLMLTLQQGGHWRSFVSPELRSLDARVSDEIAPVGVEEEIRNFLGFAGTVALRQIGEPIEMRHTGKWIDVFVLIVGKAEKVARSAAQSYVTFLARFLSASKPGSIYVTGPAVNAKVMRLVRKFLEENGYRKTSQIEGEVALVTATGRATVATQTITLRTAPGAVEDQAPAIPFVPRPLPAEGERGVGFMCLVTEWNGERGRCRPLDHPSIDARLSGSDLLDGGQELHVGDIIMGDLVTRASGVRALVSVLSLADSAQSDDDEVTEVLVTPAAEPTLHRNFYDDPGRGVECVVKWYNGAEEYGFLIPLESPAESVYFNRDGILIGGPDFDSGDHVLADIQSNDAGPGLRATAVIRLESLADAVQWDGGEQEPYAATGILFGERGFVRRYSSAQSIGSIMPAERPSESVFFHLERCVNPPQEIRLGMPVSFDVRRNAAGELQARAVGFMRVASARFEGDDLPDLYVTGTVEEPHKPPTVAGELTPLTLGWVKYYNRARGFGFVAPVGSPSTEYWFHVSEWLTHEDLPSAGQEVCFIGTLSTEGQLQARSVERQEWAA